MSASERELQECLNALLNRLSVTIDRIKSWPASGDNSVHVNMTNQLVSMVLDLWNSAEKVEKCVKNNAALRESLQQCQIPNDLLGLVETSDLNPAILCRELLNQSQRQMDDLNRRKRALGLLGEAVQSGLSKRGQQNQDANDATDVKPAASATGVKREREEECGEDEPPAKKLAAEPVVAKDE